MDNKIINLDEVIDRTEVPTLKFDGDMMQSIFGDRMLWPSWVADMDFKSPPKVIEALARRVSHGVYGYEASSDALPDAIVNWLRRRYDWTTSPDNIISTPRTLNSISVMINLFSSEGEGVIVQPPVFYDFRLIIRANKRRLVKNPLRLDQGQYQMDFDHLESIAAAPENKLLILCNPHNPVGRVWSKKELSVLSDICKANQVFVIADEIHGDLAYRNKYIPFASISSEASLNCATCVSPIKSFNLAGVANSMIMIENDEKRQLCKDWYSKFEVNKNNIFSNSAMLAAYCTGENWLKQVKEYVQGNVEILSHFLGEKIPAVKLIEPEGTYLAWLDFRELGLETRQLEFFLVKEARMATNPGHWFGREGAGFVRINIACPRTVLISALNQLEQAVNKRLSDMTK
jgi:cystathionine beta-lyase